MIGGTFVGQFFWDLEVLQGNKETAHKLYPYQVEAVNKIFSKVLDSESNTNLLFQLPTGGGKTVIFSEIAGRYIKETKRKVLILTHRIELCGQTSRQLTRSGVRNKVINSQVKMLDDQGDFDCFVAMVETLNNRLSDNEFYVDGIGLVIVDEAHYNSFRKIFQYFENINILGVTATPLSSNINLPLRDNYKELIVGESISSLIDKGYLSKATTWTFDVNLKSLKVGVTGDYTVRSSDILYCSYQMQNKLLQAYEEKSKGKKTLIFNNGIATSKSVQKLFEEAGYEVKHLDNTNTSAERKEILDWFHNKPDAILTSVSILTTGFDEPTVETILINRATRSLTLYHQMIGRGSRVLPKKSTFQIIDIGNNARRFGLWDEEIDWQYVFQHPEKFLEETFKKEEELEKEIRYVMPEELRARFSAFTGEDIDLKEVYEQVIQDGGKPNEVVDLSIDNHFDKIKANSEDYIDGLELLGLLEEEIEYRCRLYAACINATENYIKWQIDTYTRKLRQRVMNEID